MTQLIANDPPTETGRRARLQRVLSACQSFCCLCEAPEDQSIRLGRFHTALIALEDTKGTLSAVWATDQDRTEFAPLIDLAWKYHLEPSPVNHALAIAT